MSTDIDRGGNLCNIVENILDCDIKVNEFELQSLFHVYC